MALRIIGYLVLFGISFVAGYIAGRLIRLGENLWRREK